MNEFQNIIAGDVVWGRPIVDGKTLPRRKGIVLGDWASTDTKRVVVWFYGLGAAHDGANCHLMFRSELTPAGDIWDFSARQAATLSRAAGYYHRAAYIRDALSRHAGRMAGLDAALKSHETK